jgi:hypothetical protein
MPHCFCLRSPQNTIVVQQRFYWNHARLLVQCDLDHVSESTVSCVSAWLHLRVRTRWMSLQITSIQPVVVWSGVHSRDVLSLPRRELRDWSALRRRLLLLCW